MKKSISLIFIVFLCIGTAFSQEQYGHLRGKVLDSEGHPLPGVTVILESEEYVDRNVLTNAAGAFRFINIAPGECTLKCNLSGFKTYIQQNLDIRVGTNFDLDILMELATLEEEVTIIAESPIVDTKKVGTAMNITSTQLQEIPSARDPWVILQQAPGIFISQENVGGSHSSQQSGFISKGSTGGAHMYNVDGMSITDMSAIPNNMWMSGTSGRYYDFDSFAEIQLVTSGADASIQSSGVSINFVTRRGSNKFEVMGRIFYTDDALQGDNRTQELKELDYIGNRIEQITDYGLQLGGPIIRDKLWFWLGAGQQDIRRLTIDGLPQNQKIDSANAKLNFQISRKNRAELAFIYNDKLFLNRAASPTRPIDTTVDQHTNGNPFLKFEDEHTFSDNFLFTLKLAGNLNSNYWELVPVGGFDTQSGRDLATGIWSDTYNYYKRSQPQYNARADGNYFLGEILGGDHEVKFGMEFRLDPHQVDQSWPQDTLKYYWNGAPLYAFAIRSNQTRYQGSRLSLYLNDAYSRGRLTLNVGFRYDREKSVVKSSSVPASTMAPDILPALTFPDIDPNVPLNTFSPRIGLTFALTADRKTILRSNLARYGIQNGATIANRINPASMAWAMYFWNDINGNDLVSTDELVGYPTQGILSFTNFDPSDPTRLEDPDAINSDLKSILTDEFLIGVERELFTDFSLSATFILRRNHQFRWSPYYEEETGWKEGQENWLGPIQKSLTYDGVTYDYEYWTLDRTRPAGTILENAPSDRYSNYTGIEIAAFKRLSHRWMMNLSFTYQTLTDHFGENGYLDPTNIDKWDGQIRDYDSRWLTKLSFLYQLPWGLNFSCFANAREGTVFQKQLRVSTPERAAVGIGSYMEIDTEPYGTTRLANFYNVDLSLVKDFILGRYGRLTLQIDAFNVFNFNHTLNRYWQVNSSRYQEIQQILNPRVIRFGLRYRY